MAAEPGSPVVVAAVQMCSGPDLDANLKVAGDLLREARSRGSQLAVLPENFAFMGRNDAERIAIAEQPEEGPVQAWLAAQAEALGLWLIGGTLPLCADSQHFYSSCLVYAPDGVLRARYDKIHLFDVTVPGSGESYRESERSRPGTAPVVCPTPLGGLGLAVCYDLRFPEQFRLMLDAGMQALAIPAAFTRRTGAVHWELLLRARAVENLVPVIAAAQGGRHESGRETWGHSMIIDAWGTVLAEAGDQPGVITAALDLARASQLRESFPALRHRRL